jgi:hypothetical protein
MISFNFLSLFLKPLYLILLTNLKLKMYTLLKTLALRITLKILFLKSLMILA